MKKRFTTILFIVAVWFTCLRSPVALGTTIVPQTWEELVLHADFVGVVECIKAGGIVAGYRVLESWKGPAKGTEMLVAIQPDAFGNQFPTMLCGDRILFMAYRMPQTRLSSITFTHGFPLWWRRIQPDYVLPMFQGQWLLDGSDNEAYNLAENFGKDVRTIDQVRKKVNEFLFFDDQELLTLRDRAVQTLDEYVSASGEELPASKKLRQEVESAKTANEVLRALIEMPAEDERQQRRLVNILAYGGREKTLAMLEALQSNKSPLSRDMLAGAISQIRWRLGTQKHSASLPTPPEPSANSEKIETARKTFLDNEWGPKRFEVFDLLVKHDPSLVADALLIWESLDKRGEVTELGYEISSAFCFRCGMDRTANFIKLLGAKDPYVRVAAAVYLCFEDKEAGARELLKLSKLPGISGDWVAVVRIERGDKEAMQRALTMLDPELHKDDNPYAYSALFHALRDRLLVVLSNTASHHHLHLPKSRVVNTEEEMAAAKVVYFQEMREWWQRNRDKVEIQNPWGAALDLQKID